MKNDQDTFDRQQLYDLVWSTSLLTLSKKYLISDVGLRKICKRMGVPMPVAGYWAKVQHGHKPKVTSLPPVHSGQVKVSLYLRDEAHPALVDGMTPVAAMQQLIERECAAELRVFSVLTDPDPLTVALQDAFEKQKKAKHYEPGGTLFSGPGMLSVRLTAGQQIRGLCLLDAFVKVMRKRGRDFDLQGDKSFVVFGQERAEFTMREAGVSIVAKDQPGQGKLELKFISLESVTGRDGKVPMEEQLVKIIARLELMMEKVRILMAENRARWARQEEERKQAALAAERQKQEILAFQRAVSDAERWQQADALRGYIAEVEGRAQASGELSEEVLAWISWARQKADWFDPLVMGPDEWMKGIDPAEVMRYEGVRKERYPASPDQERRPERSRWPLLPWYAKNKL
ncbi:hypothetical protein C8P68_1123 [Mucilaginibacter yixingensis]|uniref:Uncharacterized protein n=1 Tax=Mucilaginibacter yixingensis TaxID=1295612 RepID=A0A2T5J4H2_9SPHI|nr:hypothetical protein [Mucilaginibacter yixingensis]PTQ92403.1 hypothetical protein C8P68_1123 [Mucilaginibacter yixingensis]